MTDDKKQELMTQFCIAYCGILAKHTLCATNTTGNMIKDATGLEVSLFLSHEHGGCQQIGTASPTTRLIWSCSLPPPGIRTMRRTSIISPPV